MTNFSHSITAAIGALLISTMFIGAAVGPGANVRVDQQVAQVQSSAQAHA